MRVMGLITGIAAAAALMAASGAASAQSRADSRGATPPADLSAPSITSNLAAVERTQPQQRRGLQWNENGRWGLNLDLAQPVGREADWSDVEAAAYYRLNQRLRVGAAASLAEPQADPARPGESDRRAQPRVRLETIFRF